MPVIYVIEAALWLGLALAASLRNQPSAAGEAGQPAAVTAVGG